MESYGGAVEEEVWGGVGVENRNNKELSMKKFPQKMQEHLIEFKENKQYIPPTNPRKRWEYIDLTDNLFPPVRHGFLQYAYESSIAFHDYARHVRSSQVFCFNLFSPLWV